MKHSLVLGSTSPRRKEILSYFSLPFRQVAPDFDEDSIAFSGNPSEYVCQLANGKAESLAKCFAEDVILTADTIVYRNGKIFGKPKTLQESFEGLSELVGQWHTVYTGVAVKKGDHIYKQAEATKVLFKALTPVQIRHYQLRMNWADKAGGYAIQGAGGLIVNKIDGCYYNVMGLPTNTVHTLLLQVGIDLWDYL